MARGDVHIIGHWGGALCGSACTPSTTRRVCQECVWAEERYVAPLTPAARDKTPDATISTPASRVVVSMTTIHQRRDVIVSTLRHLAAQSRPPDEIRIYVPLGCRLPLVKLAVPVLFIASDDHGPVTKLSAVADDDIPNDAIIVTADDDVTYRLDWLATLLEAASQQPHAAVGMAGWNVADLVTGGDFRRVYNGACDVLEGWAGIAYRKAFFDADILQPLGDFRLQDDIWVSSYLNRKRINRRVVSQPKSSLSLCQGIHDRPGFIDLCRRVAAAGDFTSAKNKSLSASSFATEQDASLRVLTLHSPLVRCGIAEYGRQLDDAIATIGLRPRTAIIQDVAAIDSVKSQDAILVHFEPSLMCIDAHRALERARSRGARVVFCCHYFDEGVRYRFNDAATAFVTHRRYNNDEDGRMVEIPLGCPCYTAPRDRRELRDRLGLPVDAVILTTIGLMSPWKHTPDLVRAVLQAKLPAVFFQVLTPALRDDDPQVTDISNIVAHRQDALFSTDFRPETDLLDRIHASDVGVLYHPQSTGSVSAATKGFVSGRTPLVVSNSTHSCDLRGGVARTDGDDSAMAVAIIAAELCADERHRDVLRREMESEYERLNMVAVAHHFLDLFARIREGGCTNNITGAH